MRLVFFRLVATFVQFHKTLKVMNKWFVASEADLWRFSDSPGALLTALNSFPLLTFSQPVLV